MLSVFQL